MNKKELSSGNRAFLVFILFLVLFSILQFTVPGIIGYDGYLHIKAADIIRHNGIIKSFPWTTESIIRDNYADLQFLFRLALIPFTFFKLELGAKLASILFSALCFAVFYLYLSKNKIKLPLFWTALYFLASVWLMYRFLEPRPMQLSVLFLILGIYFAERGKFIFLFIISFFYTWLYAGFVFLLAILSFYFIIESLYVKKKDYKPLAFSLSGMIAGLVINPYFPQNINLLYIQWFKVNLTANLLNQEWRAWPLIDFLKNNYLLLGSLLLASFISIKSKVVNKKTLFFFATTLFFLIFTIKSRRMQELFAPFSILFLAFSANQLLIKPVSKGWMRYLKAFFVLIIIILLPLNYFYLARDIKNNYFLHYYKDGVEWMKNNIPKGSLVFINGYTFSYLFFYNSNIYYTHGVDLTYSYLYNPEKFERYAALLKGEKTPGYNIIKEDYKPDYVFAGKIEQDIQLFKYVIRHKEDYELVYEDDSVGILKVRY